MPDLRTDAEVHEAIMRRLAATPFASVVAAIEGPEAAEAMVPLAAAGFEVIDSLHDTAVNSSVPLRHEASPGLIGVISLSRLPAKL